MLDLTREQTIAAEQSLRHVQTECILEMNQGGEHEQQGAVEIRPSESNVNTLGHMLSESSENETTEETASESPMSRPENDDLLLQVTTAQEEAPDDDELHPVRLPPSTSIIENLDKVKHLDGMSSDSPQSVRSLRQEECTTESNDNFDQDSLVLARNRGVKEPSLWNVEEYIYDEDSEHEETAEMGCSGDFYINLAS